MAESSSSSNSTGTKKRIKVHKRPSSDSTNNSINDEEVSYPSNESTNNYINDTEEIENNLPPAARDSKWVGLTYYNPNFENQIGDEIADEGEIRLVALDEEKELPLYNLFPKLREQRKSQSLPIIDESTTEITKSLIGHTPNFSRMKKSSKLNPIKLSLPSLKENPNEEIEEKPSEIGNKSNTTTKKTPSDRKGLKRKALRPTPSHTSKEENDEGTSDSMTNIRTRKKRRTKRRSDTSKDLDSESSYSALDHPIDKQKENLSKPKKNNSKERKITIRQQSSQGSLADEESG